MTPPPPNLKNRIFWAWASGAVIGIFVLGLILFLTNRKAYFVDGYGIREAAEKVTVRQILWETPELVDGLDDLEDELYDPTFGDDGSSMVFNMGRPGKDGGADLFRVDNPKGEGWGDPEPLDTLNGPENEIGANLSADGRYLFFFSDRDGGFGGYDIWFSEWDGRQWSTPLNAGPEVNTAFNEYDPAYDPYSDTLYFASNRPKRELTEQEKRAWLATQRELVFSTDYDIFKATRVPSPEMEEGTHPKSIESFARFNPCQRITYLNTTSHEGQVALTPRGDFLYFASNREGGEGGFDIYRARVLDGQFVDLENVGATVNTSHDEMDPALSLQGYMLVLSSNRPRMVDGEGDEVSSSFTLYQSTSREVFVQIDPSEWEALIGFLGQNFWWIILLVAALAGIFYLLHILRRKDVEIGMTARSLLGSLLFHAVLALLLSLWFLTYQIIESAKDPVMEADLDTDALAQEKLALEIREKVTEMLPAVEQPIYAQQVVPDMPVPNLEPLETPDIAPPPDAFLVKSVPVEILHELPEPVRRELPPSELPTPDRPEIQELAATTPAFRMEIPEVEADNSEQPQFKQLQDTDRQVRKADAPLPEAQAQPTETPSIEVAQARLPQSVSAIQEVRANPVLPTLPDPVLPQLDTATDVPEIAFNLPESLKLESDHNVETEATPEFQKITSDESLANVQPLENAVSEEEPVQDLGRAVQEQSALQEKTPVFEAKVAGVQSDKPVDNLPAFESRTEILKEIPSLQVNMKLESKRDLQAESGAPELKTFKKDINVAKAVELENAEERPELPELKVAQTDNGLPDAPVDIKVDAKSQARPVEDQLSTFKDNPELLTTPISPLVAGVELEGKRDLQAEDGAPEVEKLNADANVAKAAALELDATLPEDAVREVAAHELPKNNKAEPLISLKLLDYQPNLPELTGPDSRIAVHLPTVDLSTRLLLETQPVDQEPYLLRDPKMREKVLERLGGNEDTEKAVARALDWFTSYQEKDGRWSMDRHGGQKNHDFAATSFAVLCYFGWGIKHNEPGKYQKPVGKAMKWLVGKMGENGDFTNGQGNGMYDQGVSTMALAEAYGLTKDPKLREPLEKAVGFIIKAQNQKHGAWDYRPNSNRIDTSVSGWQIMALRSARMAGIKIEDRPFKLAAKWLDTVGAGKHRGIYGYDGRSYKTEAMVAEGLFAQQLLGTPSSHPRMQESIKHLEQKLPGRGRPDFYYWYYGCLSLYQNQGPVWDEWNARIKPIWLDLQVKNGGNAGSWDPKGGRHMNDMGRVISTALATLSLEVYYRYLPLYQERAITLTLRE